MHIEFVHNSSFGVQIDLFASVIIGPVFELHAASLNCSVQCRVESKEDQSCVSRSCVVSARGTATERHTVAVSHEE